MYLVRRNENPWFKDVEDTFNELFSGLNNTENLSYYQIPVDVLETDQGYEVELDVPGITTDDIEIHFEESVLTISSKKELKTDENLKYLTRERRFGNFKRSLKINKAVDQNGITADLKNGVLKITLPKSVKEALKPIEIKVH